MRKQPIFLSPASSRGRVLAACVLGAFTLTFAACEKGTEDAVPAPAAADAGLQQLVAMGFKKENIEDKGTYFLVEGDMAFDKSQLKAAPTPTARPGDRPAEPSQHQQPG